MSNRSSEQLRLAVCGATSVTALLCGASPVQAAPAAPAVDEVVVTATRRQVDVQDVPIAIDVFDGDQLKRSRIESIADLQFASPGLKVGGGMLARVSLRGIGPNSLTPSQESGVGSYVDGVFLGSGYEISQGYFDLERVEVLRGPQGTLYGRNATVGAINYITKAPTPAFEAGGEMSLGNYDLIQTEGYMSGPLAGDALSGRIAFRTAKHDGYTPNLLDGTRLDSGDNWQVRARLSFRPTDTLKIDLTLDHRTDKDFLALVAHRSNPALPTIYEFLGSQFFGAPPLPEGRAFYKNTPPGKLHLQTEGVRGEVAWDLGWAQLTAIGARRELHQRGPGSDFDFTAAPLITFPTRIYAHQYTQDVSLTSAAAERFEWIVGGSYFFQTLKTSGTLVAAPILGGGTAFINTPKLRTDAYAAYAEATYHLRADLAVAGGLRYSYEKKHKEQADVCASAALCAPLGPSGSISDAHWDEWTPHAALTWRPSDTLTTYVSVGRGFKAGGFNSLSKQTAPYDPEISTNYEAGVKSELFERRLVLNVAAFRMDYQDLQVDVPVLTPTPHTEIGNAAKARVEGLEVQFRALPHPVLSLDGNIAYLDARFTSFRQATVDFPPPGTVATLNATGNRLTGAPRLSINLGAQLARDLGDLGRLTLRGEFSHQGAVYFTPANSPEFRQGAYDWFNARLTFEDDQQRVTASAWIKNITDEFVYGVLAPGSAAPPGFSGTVYGSLMAPRTYGVTLGFRY